MPRGCTLSIDRQRAVIEMRQRHPRRSYEDIGVCFGVSKYVIRNILSPQYRRKIKRELPHPAKEIAAPACTVAKSESFIRPIPLSLLMGGRAPRAAKLQPA